MPRPVYNPPILLVEDKDSLRAMLRLALEAQGHTVVEARDQTEAQQALRATRPGVVLSDLRLPEGDGLGVLRSAKELDPELPVIVMTAFGSIQDAVTAMREGALDFLAKPVDPDHLLLMVERALAQRRLATENILLKEELAARRGAPQIIGEDAKLKHVTVALQRAATTDATVLLEGESGTGKELFARALHALSPRADGPFVAINCAAIPETLLETELFGHEKGSFTGAMTMRKGRFETANKGTIFLDEIGEMTLGTQTKLLRILQEREFERIGSNTPIKIDIRVITATNRNLSEEVESGKFREDLYYRLNVIHIHMPPLRERKEDIPLLVEHFLVKYRHAAGSIPTSISEEALKRLVDYDWPGNVRELENAIERAVVLSRGNPITVEHLPFGDRREAADRARLAGRRSRLESEADEADAEAVATETSSNGINSGNGNGSFKDRIATLERQLIKEALDRADGNRTKAADELGIYRRLLYAKIKEYGLEE